MIKHEIMLMGIGSQGRKAVRAADIHHMERVDKVSVYCKAEDIDTTVDGICIHIPFRYEIGAWMPEYPVKLWLADETNAAFMNDILAECKLLVIMAGLGGEENIVAKEIMKYCGRQFRDIVLYFLGTLPFKAETGYVENYLAGKMMDFLRKDFTYTVVENQVLLSCYENYDSAYEMSYLFLVQILEGVLSMLVPDDKNESISSEELRQYLCKGLIYYMEFDVDTRAVEIPDLKNPILPYDFVEHTGKVQIGMEMDYHYMLPLQELCDGMKKQIGFMTWTYNHKALTDSYSFRVRVMGRGMEGKRKIRIRSINVYPVF